MHEAGTRQPNATRPQGAASIHESSGTSSERNGGSTLSQDQRRFSTRMQQKHEKMRKQCLLMENYRMMTSNECRQVFQDKGQTCSYQDFMLRLYRQRFPSFNVDIAQENEKELHQFYFTGRLEFYQDKEFILDPEKATKQEKQFGELQNLAVVRYLLFDMLKQIDLGVAMMADIARLGLTEPARSHSIIRNLTHYFFESIQTAEKRQFDSHTYWLSLYTGVVANLTSTGDKEALKLFA